MMMMAKKSHIGIVLFITGTFAVFIYLCHWLDRNFTNFDRKSEQVEPMRVLLNLFPVFVFLCFQNRADYLFIYALTSQNRKISFSPGSASSHHSLA
jgi:hypothetical protein